MKRISNIYELNSRIWLWELSNKYKSRISLANLPDEEIFKFKQLGFDCLWLMGIWLRSKESRKAILKDAKLMHEFKIILPDLNPEDVSSSPYAVAGYEVDSSLGNNQNLSEFRKRLNKCGMRLLLDFVPNHTALDHPWLKENPDYFIRGSEDDLKNYPDLFFRHPDTGLIFAYGKDPNFPSWQDVAQLNYFNPQTRKAMGQVLLDIAPLCDGLRCDMAMLILNRVQKEIWKERIFGGNKFKEPQAEFWEEAIAALKKIYPEFLFIAEVYWGLETELLELGFDYGYDKSFYDYLRESNIEELKEYIAEEEETGGRKLKFIENHDEARAAGVFGPEKLKSAAFLLAISGGAHLYHQGQLEGLKVRVPLYLIRGLGEQIDEHIYSFYKKLLPLFKDIPLSAIQRESVALFPAWKENETYKNFIAIFGRIQGGHYLAVANYSDAQAQCYAYLDVSAIPGEDLIFKDITGQSEYKRNKEEIILRGLYLDMPEYYFHLFKILEK